MTTYLEIGAGVLAAVAGLVVAGFFLFARMLRAGAPSPPPRPWGACITTLQSNLSATDHISLFSERGVGPMVPVALYFLLPTIACVRHISTHHRRWVVLLWLLAGLDLAIVPASSCNAVAGGPPGLLTLIAAGAATRWRRDIPRYDLGASGASPADPSATRDLGNRVDVGGVVWFLLLCFLLSWSAFVGLRSLGVPFGVRVPIGMFGPALAALVVRLLRNEGFADSGFGPRTSWRAYLIALGLAPALIVVGILMSAALGIQHFDLTGNLHHLGGVLALRLARAGRALPAGVSADSLATQTAVISLVAPLRWGRSSTRCSRWGRSSDGGATCCHDWEPIGRLRAAVIVGIVWGLWHAPVIALDGFNYPDHRYAGVAMFVVDTVPFAVILAWLRFQFKSIWPGALLHGGLNAWAGLAALLLSRGDSFLGAPIGVIGIAPVAATTVWLVATGRLRDPARHRPVPADGGE